MDKPDKPDSINFKKFIKERSNLITLLESYENKGLTNTEINELAYNIILILGIDYTAITSLSQTLRCLVYPQTKEYLKLLAKRIIGNKLKFLDKQFILLNKFTAFVTDEWALVKIIETSTYVTNKGTLGAILKLEILTGLGAGLTGDKFISLKFYKQFALQLGFSKTVKFTGNAREFVKMRLFVKFKAGVDFTFDKFFVTSNCKNWNKKLTKLRMQRDSSGNCQIFNMPCQCCICPYGYDKCSLATKVKST